MFVFGSLMSTIFWAIDQLLGIYTLVMIVAVLITWVNPDPWNPIVRFLRQITEPLFNVFRRMLPGVLTGGAGIDVSPIFAILLVQATRFFLKQIAFRIA